MNNAKRRGETEEKSNTGGTKTVADVCREAVWLFIVNFDKYNFDAEILDAYYCYATGSRTVVRVLRSYTSESDQTCSKDAMQSKSYEFIGDN